MPVDSTNTEIVVGNFVRFVPDDDPNQQTALVGVVTGTQAQSIGVIANVTCAFLDKQGNGFTDTRSSNFLTVVLSILFLCVIL